MSQIAVNNSAVKFLVQIDPIASVSANLHSQPATNAFMSQKLNSILMRLEMNITGAIRKYFSIWTLTFLACYTEVVFSHVEYLPSDNSGDAAIVPYYTTDNGRITGVHVTNLSEATQIIKFRLIRGSTLAMNFVVVLSPKDVWTAAILANSQGNLSVRTTDASCTVPAFNAGEATIPSAYSAGSGQGYIEIIGMAQTVDETQPIAVSAKHSSETGIPKDCEDVRSNFYRVSNAEFAEGVKHRGVHHSEMTSNGEEFSYYTNTFNHTAFTVSFFIRETASATEFGGRAYMIGGLANFAMMTNQVRASFDPTGKLKYDPYYFGFPNLLQGSMAHSLSATRITNHDGQAGPDSYHPRGSLYQDFRDHFGVAKIKSEWANLSNTAREILTDWVVTQPAQYVFRNDMCHLWSNFTCGDGYLAFDEVPLELEVTATADRSDSRLRVFDRDEKEIKTYEIEEADEDLTFFYGGGQDTDIQYVPGTLPYAINVLTWEEVGNANAPSSVLNSHFRTRIKLPLEGAMSGWAEFTINSQNATPTEYLLGKPNLVEGASITAANTIENTRTVNSGKPVVLGGAFWKRSFPETPNNSYGRYIPHSVEP